MLDWLLPLGSLQTRGGNFTVWFYSHDDSIRKWDKGMGMDFTGMRSGWWDIPVQAWLPVYLGLLPNSRQKKSWHDLKSHVQSWNEIQTAEQHCIWLWESFPREKAFWLEHFVPVISLWLFSLPNSDPSHSSPASPTLPEGQGQPGHAMLPFDHTEARQEVILFPHRAHSICCQHSLTAERDLCLIWAVRSQGKQRMWLQSSSLSEQDSWNGIQLPSVRLICSYRVKRVQGVLLRYFKYKFPWMLQKWLYICCPSGK